MRRINTGFDGADLRNAFQVIRPRRGDVIAVRLLQYRIRRAFAARPVRKSQFSGRIARVLIPVIARLVAVGVQQPQRLDGAAGQKLSGYVHKQIARRRCGNVRRQNSRIRHGLHRHCAEQKAQTEDKSHHAFHFSHFSFSPFYVIFSFSLPCMPASFTE